jgi:integral membrane protein (TIGR01906 family)
VVLVVVAVLPLLGPWFMHPALDQARSADWLGLTIEQTYAFSDRTVGELVFGPGDFAFDGPDGRRFYDPAEASHLRDARALLWLVISVAAVCGVGLAVALGRRSSRAWASRAAARGGLVAAVGVIVIGVASLVAFDALFELFHRLFFPGGNWAFDPRTERMVQLYPTAFWQIAAGAFGVIVFALGVLTFAAARRRTR